MEAEGASCLWIANGPLLEILKLTILMAGRVARLMKKSSKDYDTREFQLAYVVIDSGITGDKNARKRHKTVVSRRLHENGGIRGPSVITCSKLKTLKIQ